MLQRFTLHGRRPDDTERVACSVGGRAFEGRPPALPLPGAHAGAHPGHRVPAGRGPVPAEPTRNLSTSKKSLFTRPYTRGSTHTTGSRTNGSRRRRPIGISSQATREFPTREDVAESFLMWFAVRFREDRISARLATTIRSRIPNRLAFFDVQDFDVTPVR